MHVAAGVSRSRPLCASAGLRGQCGSLHYFVQQGMQCTWMISAHSGPIRCTPTTFWLSDATSSFMKPRPSFPLIVFFIGLIRQAQAPRIQPNQNPDT